MSWQASLGVQPEFPFQANSVSRMEQGELPANISHKFSSLLNGASSGASLSGGGNSLLVKNKSSYLFKIPIVLLALKKSSMLIEYNFQKDFL